MALILVRSVKAFRLFWLIAGTLLSAINARANVYATDIQVNGSLGTISNAGATPLTISYRLNQAATLGVTVSIWQGVTNVAAIAGGTALGLNSVVWSVTNNSGSNVALGTYSLSVTAAATGFADWEQISVDSNPGMPAFYPLGIAVDNNSTSPYYGRVVMSCALLGNAPTNNVPLAAERTGLYKMNADGSQADEGWYGNANYLNDDGDDAPVAGQMPNSGGFNPMKIRIGDDDRIYWVDDTYLGAIIACDMQATTNQVVINNTGYIDNPEYLDLNIGIQQFDVTGTTTTNAAVWLCDNDNPSWGIWMYHLTNGASNPTDKYGVQVVQTGFDLNTASSGGCMIDNALDVFAGEHETNEAAVYDAMVFTNWNAGVLPPADTNGTTALSYVLGGAAGQVEWGYGCGVDTVCSNDPGFEANMDVVINSRSNPTLVACPMAMGDDNGNGGGIRVLSAIDGSIITNAADGQSLANIDYGQAYTCAAWDNVGNLYGASTTLNLWRVWSPPGPSTNTTVALPSIIVTAAPELTPIWITGIKITGATAAITFTNSISALPSSFSLQSSSALNGTYTTIASATVMGNGGLFTASTTTTGAIQFYRISQ